MASPHPLKGLELIDCARANATNGLEVAAELCGYGNNVAEFQAQLSKAFQDIGLDYRDISSLLTDSDTAIAPPPFSQS